MGQKVSLDAAAELLGVSKYTVRRMITDGKLPGYKVGRQSIRVDTDDIAAAFTPITPKGCTMSPAVGRWTVDDDTREWVAANVAAAPALTPEQRNKLADLLAPVRCATSITHCHRRIDAPNEDQLSHATQT